MIVKKTEKGTKKFTKEEKLSIIEEAGLHGVRKTLDKYDLLSGTYYYWKRKLMVYGEEGLVHVRNRDLESINKTLEKENEALKILLAERELESKLKDDLLKKKYPELRKRR